MKRVSMMLCIASALMITGCTPKYTKLYQRPTTAVPSTPYKAGGLPKFLGVGIVVNPFEHPFGYQDEKLGDASFKVIVETNTVTSHEQTTNIALMRLAELGQENNFNKFRLTNVAGGAICRDNVGVPRNVVVMFAQFGNGDGPVGTNDAKLTDAVRRASQQATKIPLLSVGKEYEVADVITKLGQTVRNPDSAPDSTAKRIAIWEEFRTKCWGKPS